MKINFRKITALATSALMIGMTMGAAAAANYPAPFVSGGAADVAIVYGTGSGVSQLDLIEAGNLQANLQSFMTGSSGGTSVSTSGEVAALDSSADRIWLNTSLNTIKSTLTKSDLPTVLADYTFSGNVDSKLTSTIKLQAGAATGTDHSGKVIYEKQPKSSDDPVVGISMGTSATAYPLYNASITMSAINFTSPDSEGQEIDLFGQKFTISADTDLTDLVLLKEAQRVTLSSDNPTATVTVGGETYTVELLSASDTSADIQVTDSAGNSDNREVNEADSKKIEGLEVGVITADETNLKLSATVIVGADKLTFTNGAQVTKGDNADPIDGTLAYIKGTSAVGTANATTELAVTVFAPDTSDDSILPGESFVDPVFGSFKVDFAGLSSPLDDPNRETISVQNSGDDTESLTMTDSEGNTKTVDFAHNATAGSINFKPINWRLADDSNESIYVYEMANLTEDEYTIVGNEDYGHLIQVTQIYNYTGSDYTKDRVKFQDAFSGETYSTVFTSECGATHATCGSVSIDGKSYGVFFNNSGDGGYVQLKYPTSDSADDQTFVLYPTIETKNGALVALYEPLAINLGNVNKSGIADGAGIVFQLPDGDGYTSIELNYSAAETWSINAVSINTSAISTGDGHTGNYTAITVGKLKYNFSQSGTVNITDVSLVNPETNANIDEPGVIILEGKDDNSAYNGVVVDLENAPAGTSTDGVGVGDVLMSSAYYHSDDITLPSDSDMSKQIDWWGTLASQDSSDSDQKIASISYPKSQVYAQLYVAASGAAVSSATSASGSTQLGDVLVQDSQVSSVATKNLIVVGGSCINSAAATLVGGAKCSADWTAATGVGAGQFLIKGYASSSLTSKVALLVAGYEAADTVNAAKYLRTQTVDTGKEYKGTSATSATLVTSSA
jgi:hypothetical protein